MKLAGKIGFRKVMVGLFALYFFFIFVFFKISNPVKLVEEVNLYYPNVDGYLSHLTPGMLQYLPNQWVADFLFNIARGRLTTALPYAEILLSVTVIAFCICLLVAHRFYYKSWLVSLQVQSDARAPYDPTKIKLIDFRSGSLLPSQLEVLLKKEFFTFFREASQWIHLVVMIVLSGLFAVSVSNLKLQLRVLDVQFLTYLILFAFGGFLVSSLALRFSYPMIGLEGSAFWTMRSCPIKENKIFFVKLAISIIMVLILAEFVAISSNIPFVRMTERRPLLMWFGIFSAMWISLATVSLNLGLGGYFANYSEKNPIRAASTQGATLTFLLTLVYLIVLVVIIIVPLSSYFESLFIFKQFKTEIIVIPGTIFGIISYLLSVFGIIVGLRSMRRDF